MRAQKAASSAIFCSRIFVLLCECFCALIFLLLVCFCLQVFLHLFIKKNNKQVWSWWPHLPILLTCLLSTFLWKIYLYAIIFILNLWLFVIICENFFFLWESLPVSDHNENLSLFKIIMRISPYLWPSWESLLIYDHLWESLFNENLYYLWEFFLDFLFVKIYFLRKSLWK